MTEEILDIVDDNDTVIGQATYEEVHAKKLTHHVAIGFLFNEKNEILLQLRSKNKSAYPSYWSISMGGHIHTGESYETAIARETEEEVGVKALPSDFVFKGKGTEREHAGAKVFWHLFELHYDGPIEEQTEEVDAVQFADFATIRNMLDANTEKLHPIMVNALKEFYAKELGYLLYYTK